MTQPPRPTRSADPIPDAKPGAFVVLAFAIGLAVIAMCAYAMWPVTHINLNERSQSYE